MSTATILATSNVASASTIQHAGAEPASEDSERFSQVLDRQHDAHKAASTKQAPERSEETPIAGNAGKSAKTQDLDDDENPQASSTRLINEHAAGLPQLALEMAAQVKSLRHHAQAIDVVGRGASLDKLTARATSADDATAPIASSGNLRLAAEAESTITARANIDLRAMLHGRAQANQASTLSERQGFTAHGTDRKLAEGLALASAPKFASTRAAATLPLSGDGNKAGASRLDRPNQAGLSALGLASGSTSADERAEFFAAKNIDIASALTRASPDPMSDSLMAGHSGAAIQGGLLSASLPATGSAAFSLLSISTPLHNPQWSSDFGRQLVSLVQGGHNMPHTAELRLDPPELGPLRISINISDNIAHAVFVSPHAAVRQTIEQSLPQLQQLLADAGLSLGQTSVSDQGHDAQDAEDAMGNRHGARTTAVDSRNAEGLDTSPTLPTRRPAPDALVDTFA